MARKKTVQTPAETSAGPHRVAVGVALLLLISSGAGFQWLAARYARASESVPIPPGTLARLPMTIGDWQGEDVPVEDRIVQATDTDDHVNRSYWLAGGKQGVGFWLAYGVRSRDLMPHRPEVCYPGAGWTLERTENLTLTDEASSPLPCRILRFRRGALQNECLVVLNYYLVDGEYSPDVSAVRRRSWQFKSELQYVAQVQVTCKVDPWRGDDTGAVRSFAEESAPEIRSLLAEAVEAAQTSAD